MLESGMPNALAMFLLLVLGGVFVVWTWLTVAEKVEGHKNADVLKANIALPATIIILALAVKTWSDLGIQVDVSAFDEYRHGVFWQSRCRDEPVFGLLENGNFEAIVGALAIPPDLEHEELVSELVGIGKIRVAASEQVGARDRVDAEK